MTKFISLLLATAAVSATSAGAVIVTNTTQTNDSTIAETFTVSNTDLLQTNLANTSLTGMPIDQDPNVISRLTNGAFGLSQADCGCQFFLGDGNSVTYTLDGAYNLTSIATFSGWDSFRGGQSYTVSYATAAAPASFIALASVYNNATSDQPGLRISTRAVITPESDFLASNVVAVKFAFNSDLTAGYAAYREIDVFGTAASGAVPEPASWAMLIAGFGLTGAAARRRRSVAVAA